MLGSQTLQEDLLRNNKSHSLNCLRQQAALRLKSLQVGSLLRATQMLCWPQRFNTKLREEAVPGLSDSDGRRPSYVTVFLLLYFCSLLRTCTKWQNFCWACFGQVFELCSEPKVRGQRSRSASCTHWLKTIPFSTAMQNLKLVPSHRWLHFKLFDDSLIFFTYVHLSSQELKVWALPLSAVEPPGALVRKEDSEPQDLKGFGMAEAGARDVNLLTSIPEDSSACESSRTTIFCYFCRSLTPVLQRKGRDLS